MAVRDPLALSSDLAVLCHYSLGPSGLDMESLGSCYIRAVCIAT